MFDIDLFRFMAVRAAVPANPSALRIEVKDVAADPTVADRLRTLGSGTSPQAALTGSMPVWAALVLALAPAADAHERHGHPGPAPVGLDLAAFDAYMALADDRRDPTDIAQWVQENTRRAIKDLVLSDDFRALRRNTHAALILSLSPPDGEAAALGGTQLTRATLVRAVRLLAVIEFVADDRLDGPDEMARILRAAPIVLPARLARPMSGLLRPPAIADLKVVRTGPPRYVPGAIAHVENVMGRESRERTFRTLEQVETTTVTETETTRETSQELGTNSQLTLQQEASSAISEATQMEAGVKISASYGPAVDVDLDARVARQDSREESARTASQFATQITRTAREEIVERQREQRTMRQLVETEEKNTHGFNNSDSDQVIVGVYRWLDTVQDCWVENYGQRLLVDLLVPEPAAYLRWADGQKDTAANSALRALMAAEPMPPANADKKPLSATDIKDDPSSGNHYLTLAARYGVSKAPTPPAPTADLSLAWHAETQDGYLSVFADADKLKVPEGYQAVSWSGSCVSWSSDWKDDRWVYALIGVGAGASGTPGTKVQLLDSDKGAMGYAQAWDFSGKFETPGEPQENSSIPVVLEVRHAVYSAVGVTVRCELTSRGWAKWQQSVYDAILTAYQKSHDDWQVAVVRTQAQAMAATSPAEAASPTDNRRVERQELRRSVLQMLLGYAVNEGVFAGSAIVRDPDQPDVPPRLDLNVAASERELLVFLEEAFDWANMTWVLYPYYWEDDKLWPTDVRRTGADPLHAQFLAAGAARVVVPARPGFEAAVSLFVATGLPWSGGQVPTVGDPTYVAIADEVAQALGTGGDPVLDRVDLEPVQLPTNLIWLQTGSDLNPEPEPVQ